MENADIYYSQYDGKFPLINTVVRKNNMKWSPSEQHDFLSGFANIFLLFAGIMLVVHSVAPLFGGKFLLAALLCYGSWIVFALCLKVEAKGIKEKELKNIKIIAANVVELACLVTWFHYPYNLVGVFIFSFLKFFGYRALLTRRNI